MFADGICQVSKNFFSKTVQFYDINYQLALNEDKTTIFENYCDFLNYFDSSISVQLSFINQQVDVAEFEKSIDIPDQNDDFNEIREEYRTMLKNQLSKGNNGLVKSKYITFGIEAESLKVARPRPERIEADILNNFKVLGAQAHPLNGVERLEIMYHVFNQDRIEPFRFNYKMLPQTGFKTKDFIAPTSFNFSKNTSFMMGKTLGNVSYLQILAPELTDRMLADFLDVDESINVNIHIQSIDQTSAIKMIKSKISDLDKMKIEEQKRAVRSGYDMDVLPSDLVTYGEEAKNLLEDLQSRNERMFLVTVLVMNTAETAATIATGRLGIFHGMKSYFCQDEFGQIAPIYSISAGLDYPGIGPEHAMLYDSGRAEYVAVTDDEAVEAFEYMSRTEGIIPAIESAHAVSYAMKLAPTMTKNQIIVINISGRGDKDCAAIARYRGEDIHE